MLQLMCTMLDGSGPVPLLAVADDEDLWQLMHAFLGLGVELAAADAHDARFAGV